MGAEATVADYMTPSPHTIGAERSAREALRHMRSHHIHHLPVLHGAELVGMVSERDASLVVEMADDAASVTVEDVMASEPYCAAPDETLAGVARTMARRRIGSAVVVQERDVVGVLTSTDALYALADQLHAGVGESDGFAAHRERQYRLARHARVRHLVATTDRAAVEVLADARDESARAALSRRLRRLLRVLSIEVIQPTSVPSLADQLDELSAQRKRLETTTDGIASVASAIHGSLQHLRGLLRAQEEHP